MAGFQQLVAWSGPLVAEWQWMASVLCIVSGGGWVRKEIRQMKNKVNDMWTVVTMR